LSSVVPETLAGNERLAKISSILENENVMINRLLNTCAFPKDEYEIMLN